MGAPPSVVSPFDNSGNGPLRVPGIGLPYNYGRHVNPSMRFFSQELEGGFGNRRLTVREIAMLRVMNALTDKPNWNSKIFDEAIVAKWKEEALKMRFISEKTWEWCLAELRDKAKEFEKTSHVLALDTGSRVCKSDVLVDEGLRGELIAATKPLREEPGVRDWHPRSNEQVLNLVHPSLYPLVYGRTLVLADGGRTTLDNMFSYNNTRVEPVDWVKMESIRHPDYVWSREFQWLPCEVEFSDATSTDVRITSYINNLHPRHQRLYTCIEKILALTINTWNDVLVEGYNGRTPVRILTYGAQFNPAEPPDMDKSIYEAIEKREEEPEKYAEALKQINEYLLQPDDYDDSEDDGDLSLYDPEYLIENGLSQTLHDKWKRLRQVDHPEPGVSYTYEQWKRGQVTNAVVEKSYSSFMKDKDHEYYSVNLEKDFRDRGLQVIIKISGIELTPEKPSYAGGSWHVEGMANEHIVATAVYYYDVENVTESSISFRTLADLDSADMSYEQDDHDCIAELFGVTGGELRDWFPDQVLGSVKTSQGRLLAFPNTLHHKVQPFELVDKERPGHRRFMVMWLVDPNYRVCSTRNVPPQQNSWWAPEAYEKIDFSKLPGEIVNMITDGVGEWPMSREEAERIRLQLMDERTRGTKGVVEYFETHNFCEH